MLRVENVAHHFMGPAGVVEALAPISFSIEKGQFVCLIGPSGCGKSTLMRIIAGLLVPSLGTVYVDDVAIRGPQRHVGLVFQQSNLMPWRTVTENLALPLELAGVDVPTRNTQVGDVLTRLGLDGFGAAYPAELSGGMAQRVAIGRALVYNPELLLLDEPFGALDAMTREQMQLDLLKLWANKQKTALMVTHSITEAVFVADRVLVMSPRPGRLRADLAIELPRPRTLDMIHAPDFGKLVQQIRELIGAV